MKANRHTEKQRILTLSKGGQDYDSTRQRRDLSHRNDVAGVVEHYVSNARQQTPRLQRNRWGADGRVLRDSHHTGNQTPHRLKKTVRWATKGAANASALRSTINKLTFGRRHHV